MTTEERISALTGAVQIARETFMRYAEIHHEKLSRPVFTEAERLTLMEKYGANLALADKMQSVLDATKEPVEPCYDNYNVL